LLTAWLWGPTAATAGDEALCAAAIRRVEAEGRLPRGLLTAVALTESGRRDPESGTVGPWPWTADNGGDGRYFDSEAEAVGWVEELRRAGRQSVDVGCMQVNLMHHPDAFASLRQAFDPAANVAYGARFLTALHDETGSWDRAVERYHSAEPGVGEAYRERVYANWQAAPASAPGPTYARVLTPTLPGPPQRPVLAMAGGTPRFIPITLGPGGRVASPAPLRPLPPRGAAPIVLGPTRAIPGAITFTPKRLVSPFIAPAPGRIAVMGGSPLLPAGGLAARPGAAAPAGRGTGFRVPLRIANAATPAALD